MTTSDKILEAVAAMAAVLTAHRLPVPNPGAVNELRYQASQLNAWDSYAAEKAWAIVEKAGMFYSARKHAKYPGGAERLYVDMTFDLLNRMRSQAQRRKETGS